MSRDVKIAYLKDLQGFLFRSAFESGELKCPLFPDVAPALRAWTARGVKVLIYSSGSVAAQKDLFAHTTDGDLSGFLSGYYDTVNAGGKLESGSYERIWGENRGLGEKGEWLFLSDNVGEVRAAKEAGLRAWVVWREGNKVLSGEDREGQRVVGSFEEVVV